MNNTRAIARQLLGGRVPAEMSAHTTIKRTAVYMQRQSKHTYTTNEVLLETMFSIRSMQSGLTWHFS